MAKGKHAVVAASRRYEAAMEHLDRVTTELADYKVRVRAVEGEAARVPGLVQQIEELRRHVEQNTSEELVRLRTSRDSRLDEAKAENDRLRDFLGKLLDRVPSDTPIFEPDDLDFIVSRRMAHLVPTSRKDRISRRWMAAGKRNHDVDISDNRRTVDENLGSKGLPPKPKPYEDRFVG